MKMKPFLALLLYLSSQVICEEIMLSFSSSPAITTVNIPDSINPDEGVALRTVISDPPEEGGGDFDDSPGGINEIDTGTIQLSVLVSSGAQKEVTIAVSQKRINNTLPLCFNPKPKDFSSLEHLKVTSTSDLVNDKVIMFSLVKYDCSNDFSGPAINDKSGSKSGVIAGVVCSILILLVAVISSVLYYVKYRKPQIIEKEDPENPNSSQVIPLIPPSMSLDTVINNTDTKDTLKSEDIITPSTDAKDKLKPEDIITPSTDAKDKLKTGDIVTPSTEATQNKNTETPHPTETDNNIDISTKDNKYNQTRNTNPTRIVKPTVSESTENDSKVVDTNNSTHQGVQPTMPMDELVDKMSKATAGDNSTPNKPVQVISPNNQHKNMYRDKPSMSETDKDLEDSPIGKTSSVLIKPSSIAVNHTISSVFSNKEEEDIQTKREADKIEKEQKTAEEKETKSMQRLDSDDEDMPMIPRHEDCDEINIGSPETDSVDEYVTDEHISKNEKKIREKKIRSKGKGKESSELRKQMHDTQDQNRAHQKDEILSQKRNMDSNDME